MDLSREEAGIETWELNKLGVCVARCSCRMLQASADTVCRYAGTLGEGGSTVPRVDFQGRLLPGSRFAGCCSAGACRRDSRSDEPVCRCRSGSFPALRPCVLSVSRLPGAHLHSELRVRRCLRKCPAAAWPRLGVGLYFINRRTRQPGILCALCPCANCLDLAPATSASALSNSAADLSEGSRSHHPWMTLSVSLTWEGASSQ